MIALLCVIIAVVAVLVLPGYFGDALGLSIGLAAAWHWRAR
jgi:hypothetical protein